MKVFRLKSATRLGCGSFFEAFRVSTNRVIKVPSMYDAWPTDKMESALRFLKMSAEDYILLDAINGTKLPGALPLIDIVYAELPSGKDRWRLSLLMPYASDNVTVDDIRKFVKEYPHWDWDNHVSNYGRYEGKVVRVDTQLKVTEDLFIWV